MKEYHTSQSEEIAASLLAGQVLAFPTDTVYGVGVLYGNPVALQRLKTIKRRPETKPIPMMCASLDQAEDFAIIPRSACILAKAFLPGALTLIVPLKDEADRLYTNGMDTVALRIPDRDDLLEVMRRLPLPLLVSSANLSGQPAALNQEQAVSMLPDLDGIVDGTCQQGIASTIVDCTCSPVKILRPGPVSQEQIEQALREPYLFDRSR